MNVPVPRQEVLDEIAKEFRQYFQLMLEQHDTKIMWTLPCKGMKDENKLAILIQLLPLPDDKFIREAMGMMEEKPQ